MTAKPMFPGLSTLTSRIDSALATEDLQELSHGVQGALTSTIREGAIELPEHLARPQETCYARRLLHRSPEHGYTVIAMIWGGGQGTPLHDHAGIWCVEGVLQGSIEVVQYELLEEDGGFCRFRRDPMVLGEVGSAGSLIPPYEYHTIVNASLEEKAITFHVYGSEMTEACIFRPTDRDSWYWRETKRLSYTD